MTTAGSDDRNRDVELVPFPVHHADDAEEKNIVLHHHEPWEPLLRKLLTLREQTCRLLLLGVEEAPLDGARAPASPALRGGDVGDGAHLRYHLHPLLAQLIEGLDEQFLVLIPRPAKSVCGGDGGWVSVEERRGQREEPNRRLSPLVLELQGDEAHGGAESLLRSGRVVGDISALRPIRVVCVVET